jgi:hypothetical protein
VSSYCSMAVALSMDLGDVICSVANMAVGQSLNLSVV